ncbi:enhancer of polycomb homolog 2 isoform X3 [Thalassophryne amazonica]|uniref:enhancer of polycomb homolog 2 isoform X3 n=1 Tax=Thalassophryne amazonica TaxID=390379 RepID=UPI001471FD3A|nr:enhancer of polycomb homolog 2 isoform X3 [Thalassophryne amazonica]
MSKLSFRARALDAAKPLPLFLRADLPELSECASINRTVPSMPSGMEKDEELEHHLQRAISAQQVFREKKENMVIPVPEAETNITYYDRLYKGDVKVPKQLIHIQYVLTSGLSSALGLDLEQPDYDMDSEDETLLNRLNRKMELKPLQFETMVDRLEKASTHQLISLPEAKLLLNEDDYLLKSVYDYWVRKRKNSRCPSLIPQVKQEKRDGSTNSDAYVAFRRRTEKMQTRKNRKNDEASYEKMLKLRREFSRTVTILEMIKRREKSKRELLHLTLEVVEKRYQMGDFSGDILKDLMLPLVEKPAYSSLVSLTNSNRYKNNTKTKVYKRQEVMDDDPFSFLQPKKKFTKRDGLYPPRRPGRPPCPYTVNKADIKQYDFHSSGEDDLPPPLSPASEPEEEGHPDGVFAFRRKAGCQYLSPQTEQTDRTPWDGPEPGLGLHPLFSHHSLTELSVPHHWIGLGRRRVGRGGRIILDRASSGLDPALMQLDSDTFSYSACSSVDTVQPEQKVLLGSADGSGSLTEILNSIQTIRCCCFRPKKSLDQCARSHRMGRPSREEGVSSCLSSPQSASLAGGITEEQFQNHQHQLAQMQKQLEQLHQTHAASSRQMPPLECRAALQANRSTVSKTLDSARAHFAASAVISSPVQSPLHLHGQNKAYKASVNGVLHASGTSRPLYSSRSVVPTRDSSPQSLPHQWSHIGAVSPAHHHSARLSAPSPSALKLATVAATLDRVPKVTAATAVGSIARDASEPERLTNGMSEATLAMEVT